MERLLQLVSAQECSDTADSFRWSDMELTEVLDGATLCAPLTESQNALSDVCPGTRSCYLGHSWVNDLEHQIGCSLLSNSNFLSDFQVDNDFSSFFVQNGLSTGICLCSTWYGFIGPECTAISRRTVLMLADQLLILLFAGYGLYWSTQLARTQKENLLKNTPKGHVLYWALVANAMAFFSLSLWKILLLVILLTPNGMTEIYEEQASILGEIDLDVLKFHPAEFYGLGALVPITGIFSILSSFTLTLMWVETMTKIRNMKTGTIANAKQKKKFKFRNFLFVMEGFWIVLAITTFLIDFSLFSFVLIFYSLLLMLISIYGCKTLGRALLEIGETSARNAAVMEDPSVSHQLMTSDGRDGSMSSNKLIARQWSDAEMTETSDGGILRRVKSTAKTKRSKNSPPSPEMHSRATSQRSIDRGSIRDQQIKCLAVRTNLRKTTAKLMIGSLVIIIGSLGFGILSSVEPWQEYSPVGKISLPMLFFEIIPFGLLMNLYAVAKFADTSMKKESKANLKFLNRRLLGKIKNQVGRGIDSTMGLLMRSKKDDSAKANKSGAGIGVSLYDPKQRTAHRKQMARRVEGKSGKKGKKPSRGISDLTEEITADTERLRQTEAIESLNLTNPKGPKAGNMKLKKKGLRKGSAEISFDLYQSDSKMKESL